jgi:hypothetical protein
MLPGEIGTQNPQFVTKTAHHPAANGTTPHRRPHRRSP